MGQITQSAISGPSMISTHLGGPAEPPSGRSLAYRAPRDGSPRRREQAAHDASYTRVPESHAPTQRAAPGPVQLYASLFRRPEGTGGSLRPVEPRVAKLQPKQ